VKNCPACGVHFEDFLAEPTSALAALTRAESRSMDYIMAQWSARGALPLFKIMAADLGLNSRGGIFRDINILVRKGWVVQPNRGTNRGLRPSRAAFMHYQNLEGAAA
jgi:SOS-response transcriptional repressor LexA